MTVLFVSRDSLIVDNVSLYGGFAVSSQKLTQIDGLPGAGSDPAYYAIVGDVNQGNAKLAAFVSGNLFVIDDWERENLTDSMVFVYQNNVVHTLTGYGSELALVPKVNKELEIYGDGARAFLQTAAIARSDEEFNHDSFYRTMKAVWFQHDTRNSYDFTLSGYLNGAEIEANKVSQVNSLLMKLSSVMVAEPTTAEDPEPVTKPVQKLNQAPISEEVAKEKDEVATDVTCRFIQCLPGLGKTTWAKDEPDKFIDTDHLLSFCANDHSKKSAERLFSGEPLDVEVRELFLECLKVAHSKGRIVLTNVALDSLDADCVRIGSVAVLPENYVEFIEKAGRTDLLEKFTPEELESWAASYEQFNDVTYLPVGEYLSSLSSVLL